MAIAGLLLLSGFAGLGYQIVWTRMLSVGLGHEVIAVLAVVAAFFAGLALGAWALDRRVAASPVPARWYAALEAAIGLWSLALIWLIPGLDAWVADWMGPDPAELRRWAVAFLLPALLLLPATFAMGATLPAAEAMFARITGRTTGIGGLYAANTAGAMAGALLTAFLIAPALGYSATLAIFAAVNLLCAVLALLWQGRPEGAIHGAEGAYPNTLFLGALFLTGLLGVGFEVAVVRALAQLLQNTVYSFAAVLAVYLLGTALGAAAYQALYAPRRRTGWDHPVTFWLTAAVALTCMTGTAGVLVLAPIHTWLTAAIPPAWGGAVLAEMTAAALVLGPGSIAMGALFSHLALGCRTSAGGLGRAFAANTAGGAVAPLVIGLLTVPALGVVATLVGISLVYTLLAMAFLRQRLLEIGMIAAAPALALLLWQGGGDWRLITPPSGGHVRAHVEGVSAAASVVEDARANRFLRVNGTFTMGGTTSYALDRLQGHAALLQHPAPRRALFLGVGTGATLAAAADYPGLTSEAVDLLPEVLALIEEFPAVMQDLRRAAPRTSLHVADARRYIRASDASYDVIVADNYHPAKDGSALLYTVEHFRAMRDRLTPQGVLVQWLPLHQLDLPSLRIIVASFLQVFPDARLQMGNYNLITPILALSATRDGSLPDLGALTRRETNAAQRDALSALRIATPFALFGGFMAGPEALAGFADGASLNTDDHPRLLFEAPRTVYEPLPPARERLLHLIDRFDPQPSEAVEHRGVPQSALFAARLKLYWRARNAFLRLGAGVVPSGDPSRDARALAPRLIEIVRISPDFQPAYDPVLAMARAVATREPAFARRMLAELYHANPARPDARALLDRIKPLR